MFLRGKAKARKTLLGFTRFGARINSVFNDGLVKAKNRFFKNLPISIDLRITYITPKIFRF